MKRLWVVKDLQGYDRYNHKEKCVDKDKIKEIFANDKNRVNDNGHFLVGIPKNGKYFYNCCSSEIVIDDEIAVRNESSDNDEGNRKTYDVAPWLL